MEQLDVTQAQLAGLIDLHPSSIAGYLYGKREPDHLTCLLFASIAKSGDEREFFLQAANLTPKQYGLLLSLWREKDDQRRSVPPALQDLVDKFVAFMQSKGGIEQDKALRLLLPDILTSFSEEHKPGLVPKKKSS